MQLFTPYQLKDLTLKNRIVMPPMCMYSASEDGLATDFHHVHYASRAVGGTGLIIFEATAVLPEGRISDRDLGIWNDEQAAALAPIVKACQATGAKVAIQLAHAGRKAECTAEKIYAPSALRFNDDYRIPEALTPEGIHHVLLGFREAARRANEAGFDSIELHGAHGYLIGEFLSPLTNKRTDSYGGSTKNRVRFLREVLIAVREVWPADKPIMLRISASDYTEGGMDLSLMTETINELSGLADIVHVSSGGTVEAPTKPYPGYQTAFAETIRTACHVPVIAVGLITNPEMAEEVIANDRADLVALGRELLRNPYWALQMARKHGVEVDMPGSYKRAFG